VLGEIEKIRGPLVTLIRRIDDSGKQRQSVGWFNLLYDLSDALRFLDYAQDKADVYDLSARELDGV
jgi:hypothetical protein